MLEYDLGPKHSGKKVALIAELLTLSAAGRFGAPADVPSRAVLYLRSDYLDLCSATRHEQERFEGRHGTIPGSGSKVTMMQSASAEDRKKQPLAPHFHGE
jgi:hypothetical protein